MWWYVSLWLDRRLKKRDNGDFNVIRLENWEIYEFGDKNRNDVNIFYVNWKILWFCFKVE